jgi:GntR family transcriptional repressor for pyruvate dehydrogenase complex
MGVLSQRVGDGTYLNSDAENILAEPMEFVVLLDSVSIDELMEARLLVEPELSAKAAERATVEDLAAMQATLTPVRPFSRQRMLDQDLAFDRAIFRAARNRICERIFPLLHRNMLASIQVTYRMVDWEYTLKYHKPIYTAIAARRPEEARKKMLEHLLDVRRLLKEATTRPIRVELPTLKSR